MSVKTLEIFERLKAETSKSVADSLAQYIEVAIQEEVNRNIDGKFQQLATKAEFSTIDTKLANLKVEINGIVENKIENLATKLDIAELKTNIAEYRTEISKEIYQSQKDMRKFGVMLFFSLASFFAIIIGVLLSFIKH